MSEAKVKDEAVDGSLLLESIDEELTEAAVELLLSASIESENELEEEGESSSAPAAGEVVGH